MKVGELVEFLNSHYPLALQEQSDNSGLIIGNPKLDIEHIIICLSPNIEVIKEAIEKEANVIISHHPILREGLKKITENTEEEQIVKLCLKNDISLISFHTPVDKSFGGLNYFIAQQLKLQNVRTLVSEKGLLRKLVTFCPLSHVEKVREALFAVGAGVIGNYDCCSYNVEGYGTFRGLEHTNPFVGQKNVIHKEPEVRIETIFPFYLQQKLIDVLLTSHPYEEVAYDIYPLENNYQRLGYGVYGDLDEPLMTKDFINSVKKCFNVPIVKVSVNIENIDKVTKVAICGGSGIQFLNHIIEKKVNAYITGDIKYHDFMKYKHLPIILIDVGHYFSEIYFVKLFYDLISENFSNLPVSISEVDKNSYFFI